MFSTSLPTEQEVCYHHGTEHCKSILMFYHPYQIPSAFLMGVCQLGIAQFLLCEQSKLWILIFKVALETREKEVGSHSDPTALWSMQLQLAAQHWLNLSVGIQPKTGCLESCPMDFHGERA